MASAMPLSCNIRFRLRREPTLPVTCTDPRSILRPPLAKSARNGAPTLLVLSEGSRSCPVPDDGGRVAQAFDLAGITNTAGMVRATIVKGGPPGQNPQEAAEKVVEVEKARLRR